MVPDEEINKTVYIENGTASVHLSCGKVPQSAITIEWFTDRNNEWNKILKFYHKNPSNSPEYDDFYTKDKYGLESLNASLVIKNIEISDDGLYQCGTARGAKEAYKYTTKLQVVGKLLLAYLLQHACCVQHNFNAMIPSFYLLSLMMSFLI